MDYKNELNSDDDFDNSNGFSDHNGNNGYTNGNDRLSNTNGLSKAELRKTNKPIMEKRRRARINHCLNELKSLILEAMKKDPARHTKLEKADILEMTVKHLQSVQRQQLNMAIQSDPAVIHKFKTGFVECADEVKRYINQLDGVDPVVRQRLINHLNNYANSLEQIGSMTNFNNGYRGLISPNTIFGTPLAANPLITAATQTSLFPTLSQDLNNNNNNNNNAASTAASTAASIGPATPIQMAGVHLIPSRLPSGELALIVPNPAAVGGINSMGSATTSLLSGGTQSTLPFSTVWPNTGIPTVINPIPPLPTTALTSTPLNESMANLKRNSAFTKPTQKTTNNNNTTITSNETSTFSKLIIQSSPALAPTVSPFHHPANNLHQNTTTTTSPPLSPISSSASISSHGDDSSVMHTSSDLYTPSRPTTPPSQDTTAGSQYNFCGVFNTPSSTETSSLNSSTHSSFHLQQEQQVSSTSCGELRRASHKRSRAETNDSSCDGSEDEPSAKKLAISDGNSEKIGKKTISGISEEERDNMWRPW